MLREKNTFPRSFTAILKSANVPASHIDTKNNNNS